MSDFVLVKAWHGGKLVLGSKNKYVGGLADMFQVEIDKMSYFELMDYVIEFGSYQNKDFKMWYAKPGKDLQSGLVDLKDYKDVNEMMEVLGDEFKHILHVYCQGNSEPEVTPKKKSRVKRCVKLGAQHEAHHQTPPAHRPTISPGRVTRSSSKKAEVSLPPIQDSDYNTGEDDDESDADFEIISGDEIHNFDEEDLNVVGSECEDHEWIESRDAIVKVNKEDQELRLNALAKVIQEGETAGVNEEQENNFDGDKDSSYEESDGDVLSPGDSEDDDILGKKYGVKVPVIDEHTDWEKWQWVVGTRFASREAFKEAVRNYVVANGRDLKFRISDKGRNGRLGVVCKEGCPFRLYASFHDKKGSYMVKSISGKHNCQRSMSKNTQLTAKYVADQFLHVFKLKPHWPAKEIHDAVKDKFKVLVTRWFAYKAKRCAHRKLHGSMRDHYSKLGSYLAALRELNPNSTFELLTVPPQYYNIDTSDTEMFFRLFICFESVRKGFLEGCRKVLCLDGCFLKTFLGGMLLCAIGRDANNQMFPVAYAVVEGENTLSWSWFMSELKKTLGVVDDGAGWTLISDQQKGLLNAVVSHWEKAEHRNCARHIYANWHKKHKGDELKGLFWRACRSYCEADYKAAIEEIRSVDASATEDLLKQDPKTFCRCFLKTDTECDVIVNNMVETFNGYIIQSRSKHIINMLEDIRVQLMTRLLKHQRQMMMKDVVVCPRIQEKLDQEKSRAYRCEVYPSSATLFQVKSFDDVSVDIVNRSCSCRKWDLTGIPCHHVCALAGFLNLPPEEFVHGWCLKKNYMRSYAYTIPPLPSDKYRPSIEMPIDPPPIKIGPGRPKKNRRKDPHEDPKKPGKLSKHGKGSTCGNCGEQGHNKRKCSKPPKEEGPKTKKQRGRPKKNKSTATEENLTQASQITTQTNV